MCELLNDGVKQSLVRDSIRCDISLSWHTTILGQLVSVSHRWNGNAQRKGHNNGTGCSFLMRPSNLNSCWMAPFTPLKLYVWCFSDMDFCCLVTGTLLVPPPMVPCANCPPQKTSAHQCNRYLVYFFYIPTFIFQLDSTIYLYIL